MSLSVQPLLPSQAVEAMALYSRVVVSMHEAGHMQWDDTYPNWQTLQSDIAAGTVFAAHLDGRLAGLVTVDGNEDPAYEPVPFRFGTPVMVVHRLGVDPSLRRRGISAALMDFAEQRARSALCKAIRLDTCEDNAPALTLYRERGYVVRGTCHFPPRTFTFIVMEKKL